jgi:general L-amino acid transport system permease protein
MTALRRLLFPTFGQALLTLLAAALIAGIGGSVVTFAVLRASFHGGTLADCPNPDGACWPFVVSRLGQFMFGLYPAGERWRVALALGALLALLAGLLLPSLRRWATVALILGFPVASYALLRGGFAGLAPVPARQWGGLFLTLLITADAMLLAVPLGLALALARLSSLPAVRLCAGAFVELWRGVPTVGVLFVAITLFPVFLPGEAQTDPLLRLIGAFMLMVSAFVAEAFRGSLQAFPLGQYQAARALGLGHWASLRLVVLPQTVATTLPNLINITIAMLKETTLVVIIGTYDLLGMVQSAILDPKWQSERVAYTGYAFVAGTYWALCIGISTLSQRIERRSARQRG